MSIEVKIPAVGESITSGIVSVWHKKSGDYVKAGDALFTLETDKVSTEITAEKAGVLTTKVDEGQEVKIGEVVATIDERAAPPSGGEAKAEPAKAKTAAEKPATTPGPEKRTAEADLLSPAVRRIVEEEEIDPQEIRGSGKGGRLTKADALEAVRSRESGGKEEPAAETAAATAAQGRTERVLPAGKCRPSDGRLRRRW